ncbi:MAG: cysteine desulfurase [Chloroflexota bacterium]|nr:cysteine desulfurase [Chloroflexota bacterium]
MTQTIAPQFDLERIRADFPILHQQVHGHPLAYLDSTASSQKPALVIDAMNDFYRRTNANVHRGVYQLSEQATEAMEQARGKIARFIGARSVREIIFTRNTTESINLVANAWGRANLRPGDRILLTEMEHHSNLVPWQIVAQATGAELLFIPVDGTGRLALDGLDRLLTERTKLVALTHMSNVLGTINPVKVIAAAAKQVGALVLVDGAQSVPHFPVDVGELGIDFLAFSGHKMCGPTGVGVLWGRKPLLQAMPPFLGGGSMIRSVGLRSSSWNDLPHKFEAGTPAIAEAIGLGYAVDYLASVGMDAIHQAEQQLTQYAVERLQGIDGLTLYGPAVAERGGVLSFNLAGVHAHDVAAVLDQQGVAVRAGHHCCQPLMELLDAPATARASFYLYTTPAEIDQLVRGLEKCKAIFG